MYPYILVIWRELDMQRGEIEGLRKEETKRKREKRRERVREEYGGRVDRVGGRER